MFCGVTCGSTFGGTFGFLAGMDGALGLTIGCGQQIFGLRVRTEHLPILAPCPRRAAVALEREFVHPETYGARLVLNEAEFRARPVAPELSGPRLLHPGPASA